MERALDAKRSQDRQHLVVQAEISDHERVLALHDIGANRNRAHEDLVDELGIARPGHVPDDLTALRQPDRAAVLVLLGLATLPAAPMIGIALEPSHLLLSEVVAPRIPWDGPERDRQPHRMFRVRWTPQLEASVLAFLLVEVHADLAVPTFDDADYVGDSERRIGFQGTSPSQC